VKLSDEASSVEIGDTEKHVLREHIKAQEEMLARTTTFLMEIQEELEASRQALYEQNKGLESMIEERTRNLKQTVDRLQLEVKKRESMQRDLSVANHELNTLLYRSSHDYKGPLCSAFGLLSLLEGRLAGRLEDAEALTYLKMLHRPLQKLDALTRTTTSIAEYRQNTLHPQHIDPEQLLEKLLAAFRQELGEQYPQVRVENRLQRSLHTDAHMLENILQSLLSNALRYRRLPAGHLVLVQLLPYYKQVKIRVQDNGTGIPPAFHARIFDMFFRGSELSTGSGLGLYLSRLAVQKLGGKIEIKSKEGKGTSAEVILPNL
jgi:signal transduction histidine kinase